MAWLLVVFTLVAAISPATSDALSERQAGIVTVAAFTASGDIPKLKVALNEALDAGLTINEIKEVLVQMYAYAGFPRSLNGINAFNEVVKQRQASGKKDVAGPEASAPSTQKSSLELGGEIRTRLTGSTTLAEYAKFVPIIDEFLRAHLFGDIFGRDNLDYQSREIATIAALAALEEVEPQLKSHFNVGLNVGLTAAQLEDIVAVIEDKVDAKKATAARRVLDETLRSRSTQNVSTRIAQQPSQASSSTSGIRRDTSAARETPAAAIEVLRAGTGQRQQAPSANFIGNVTIESSFRRQAPSRLGGATVIFEPGARTAWHTHPLGQTLVVTQGTGWVQREGGPKQEIREGDVVWTPPGVKHWHGATDTSAMSHVAISETTEGSQVTWMEQVSERDYRQ
jgi:4-carboxymuconolactone decarboxylase